MEHERGDMRRRGTNLATDHQARMKAPPTRNTTNFDRDCSASLGPTVKPMSSRTGVRPPPRGKTVAHVDLTNSGSEDELLLQSDPRPRQGSKEPGASGGRTLAATSSQGVPINHVPLIVDGEAHPPHPDYAVDGKEILKGMKFKKTMNIDDASASTPTAVASGSSASGGPSSSTSGTTRAAVRNSRDDPLHRPFRTPSAVDKSKLPPRKSSPTSARNKSPVRARDDPDADQTPKPVKPVPKPRPVKKTKGGDLLSALNDVVTLDSEAGGASDKEDKKGKGKAEADGDWDGWGMPPLKQSGTTRHSKRDCPIEQISPLKESSNERKAPRPFPLDDPSPLDGENVKDKKRNTRTSPPRSQKSSIRPVQSFPTISPLSSPAMPPPSSSSVESLQRSQNRQRSSTRAKGRTVISSEEGSGSEPDLPPPRRRDKKSKAPKARPFPMATQMLESIGSPPAAKRGSSDTESSDAGTEQREKKRARGADEIIRELMYSDGMSDEDEDDLLWNDPSLDPSRLCPWCDELLPPEPSPHLQHLISTARARSHSDSRPTNPLGLRAEPTVFVNVCQRHNFESHQIPLAQQRGWPTRIEWDRLAGRVRRLKHHLRRIVDDVDEEFLPGRERRVDDDEDLDAGVEDDEDLLSSRPRKGSTFWREVVRRVKKKGARKAAGVRQQMDSFSKTQPGYYGELGSVIISQTIYDLFPPADFPPNSTLPLTPTEFVQHILVPEAALRLVMEDMHQSRQEALKTLRDSAQYGVAMFPDDHTEGYSASEAIVKARAAARRKELEQQDLEDDEDAEMWNAFPEMDLSDVGAGRLSRAPSVESNRPRRACAERARPIIESDSDSDISMASTKSRSRKARAKPASKASDAERKAKTSKPPPVASREPAIEISSGSDVPKPRPRPRPKVKDPGCTPQTSDAEAKPPPTTQEIRWGAHGATEKKVRKDDGTWGTVDLEETPRPPRTQQRRLAGTSSTSSFAALITKTKVGPSKTVDPDGWKRTLADDDLSDDVLWN